jgi:wyosine [tRNA(Phe)-imidazoG37] synthetase (radical SAM superfamily)
MAYVYPVLSRRAGVVSVGINLSPNNACNFRCVYCQVPDLVAGNAPRIDLDQLRAELRRLLDDICTGDLLTRLVADGNRQLRDVALSGNGEPTSSPQLGEAIDIVGRELASRELLGETPIVLITNGSLMLKPNVGAALTALADFGGEVWFKMDSVTPAGIARINGSAIGPAGQLARLTRSAERCPTHLQTCLFAWHGECSPARGCAARCAKTFRTCSAPQMPTFESRHRRPLPPTPALLPRRDEAPPGQSSQTARD